MGGEQDEHRRGSRVTVPSHVLFLVRVLGRRMCRWTGMGRGARHMAIGARHMAIGARHMAIGARHMAIGARHMAIGARWVPKDQVPRFSKQDLGRTFRSSPANLLCVSCVSLVTAAAQIRLGS